MTKIAFLFPGQGSQSVGMGRDLYDHFPVARPIFDEADAALGFPLSKLIFEGPEEQLKLTEHTQPAILTVSVAAPRVLAEKGILPAFAAGHSLGEYSAHVAAGTLNFADAVRTVRDRGRYMQQAVPAGQGAMAAILGLNATLISEICAQASDQLTPLPTTSDAEVLRPQPRRRLPRQPQLARPDRHLRRRGAVQRAADLCKQAGAKRTVMLHVSAPFHCALMQPAQDAPRHRPRCHRLQRPRSSPSPPTSTPASSPAPTTPATASSARSPAPSAGSSASSSSPHSGATHFIEVGPGKVLSGLNRQILGKDSPIPTLNVEDYRLPRKDPRRTGFMTPGIVILYTTQKLSSWSDTKDLLRAFAVACSTLPPAHQLAKSVMSI